MKKTILTFGLFSLMMVLTSFTSAEIGGSRIPSSSYTSEIGGSRIPSSSYTSEIGGSRIPNSN